MNYIEVSFCINPPNEVVGEILIAHLAEIGFDSFAEGPSGPIAYITKREFVPSLLPTIVQNHQFLEFSITYTYTEIEERNWNKEWESNFNPITIENLCRIRAPFHEPNPNYAMEIVIEPKMSFGTGHHQTTWLVARELFNLPLQGKKVLDMGCGTGILAIIAEKLGAAEVTAIDNDEWAYRNSVENVAANGCSRITVKLGDAQLLSNMFFDVIVANINLNILLADMETYAQCLNPKGLLILSGILNTDMAAMRNKIERIGLQFITEKTLNGWALIACKKH